MNFSALARSVSQRISGKKKLKKEEQTKNSYKSQPSISNASSLGTCSIAIRCSDNEENDNDDDDDDEKDNNKCNSDRLNTAAAQLVKRQQPYQQIVEQILHQVSELEHTLYEDQQEEFKLRLTLERQTERINELNFSLDTEKQRNNRLVQLLRNIDNSSISDDSEMAENILGGGGSPVKSNGNLYESISPLLMQQRYDDLVISHRQSRRQLAKKERAYKNLQCKTEELKSKYDRLFDEFRIGQRRLEQLCTHFLQIQFRKKQQICNLKNSLSTACECIFYAQEIIDIYNRRQRHMTNEYNENLKKYNQNFDCFMVSLRGCCCQQKLQELQQKKPKMNTNTPSSKEPSMISSDATITQNMPKSKSQKKELTKPTKCKNKKKKNSHFFFKNSFDLMQAKEKDKKKTHFREFSHFNTII